jgi:hypothetical protein
VERQLPEVVPGAVNGAGAVVVVVEDDFVDECPGVVRVLADSERSDPCRDWKDAGGIIYVMAPGRVDLGFCGNWRELNWFQLHGERKRLMIRCSRHPKVAWLSELRG